MGNCANCEEFGIFNTYRIEIVGKKLNFNTVGHCKKMNFSVTTTFFCGHFKKRR